MAAFCGRADHLGRRGRGACRLRLHFQGERVSISAQRRRWVSGRWLACKCYILASCTASRTEDCRSVSTGPPASGCFAAVGLLADCDARVAMGGVECHPPRSGCLAKWFQSARLETRTKESDMCASVWVSKTRTRNESDVGWDGRKACTIDRSGYFFDRFE